MGEEYYHAKNGREKDYVKARTCYERALALDPKCINALYSLGWLYEHGQGVDKDIPKAREYYEKAALEGDDNSRKQLLLLEHPRFTASQWNDLGASYYRGRNNGSPDYLRARICYERAHELDSTLCDVAYVLGMLFHYGAGVDQNLDTARSYYEKASQAGSYDATKKLVEIANPHITDAAGWNARGEEYYNSDDYIRARVCYELTLGLNQRHINALNKLGCLYEHGKGVAIDDEKAHACRGKAERENLKNPQKTVILGLRQSGLSLDTKDGNGNTALHRAAEYKHLKICARLLFFGASKQIPNVHGVLPMHSLTEPHNIRISSLQNKLQVLVADLKEKPSRIIVECFQYRPLDETSIIAQLDGLYSKPAIKPLLDLAKLAALGLHDLAERKKFADILYDSDDEEGDAMDALRQCLTVWSDPDSGVVGRRVHYGQNGLAGNGASGVYLGENALYMAGRPSLEACEGTFVHELIHFLAKEVLKNNSRPYAVNDVANKERFAKIANDLRQRKNSLDPVLQEAFLPGYETKDQVHGELLVRVGEMIVTYPDGLQRIKAQALDLWNYYNDVFLAAVKKHTNKLQERALSGWPLDQMVDANASVEPYHFGSQASP